MPRWTIVRVNHRQNVAEHSFFVALYAFEIAKFLQWEGDYERLALHALTHDLDEIVTGDINSPTKQSLDPEAKAGLKRWIDKKMAERSDEHSAYSMSTSNAGIRAIVKLADIVEALLYLAGEMAQGNTNVEPHAAYMWSAMNLFLKSAAAEPLTRDHGRLSLLLDKIGAAYDSERRGHDKVVA